MDQTQILNIPVDMLIVQGVGFIAMFMHIISFQQNTNKRIVGIFMIGSMFWCCHFVLLEAFTGAAITGLGIIRSFVFFFRPRKWASGKFWLYLFCTAYIISGILTYDSIVSIFPVIASIFITIGFYVTNPKLTRRFALVSSFGDVVYAAFVFSVAGILADSFSVVSIIIAMFRFDFKKDT